MKDPHDFKKEGMKDTYRTVEFAFGAGNGRVSKEVGVQVRVSNVVLEATDGALRN